MNARVAAILVLLLAVLGGAALLSQRQDAARQPDAGALGQPLLKGLKAADVAAIRIVEPGATLTLKRKDDGWTIAERGEFPASLATVRDFVLKAIELKAGQSEALGEKDRARLQLDASATQVEFQGADGKPLARMLVGKKYFKRDPDDPAKAPADGRFVLLPEAPERVFIVADPLAQAAAQSRLWIDRTAFKIEKVGTLELRHPDGSGWRIERSGDNADWKLAGGAPAGMKLDTSRANAASYMLSQLELADVAAPGAKDTGLDAPTLIRATTLGGARYEIKVGKLAGDDYFVSFTSSADDAKEKALAQHVLLVPKSKLEDTLRKRDEMLEKVQPAGK
ncbi:MAG TPA: DUF4340 domain-containing protein [Burkholderiales bacterium]|nr:DUF4340 domain-containing protein [Burkholderiales bacterium]